LNNFGKPAVGPNSIFFILYQSGVLQDVQVTGNSRLRNIQNFPDFANAKRPFPQHFDNSEPVPVTQSLKNFG
jgi:hypothetical protein